MSASASSVEANYVYFGPAVLVAGPVEVAGHAQVTYEVSQYDEDQDTNVTYWGGMLHGPVDLPELGEPVALRLPDGTERELTNVASVRRPEKGDTLVTWWPPHEPWVHYSSGGLGTV